MLIVDDDEVESSEQFVVNLTNAVGTTISDGQGVATINDNDTPGNSVFSFTAPSYVATLDLGHPMGVPIGTNVSAVDPNGGSVTYSILPSGSGTLFTIDSVSGVIEPAEHLYFDLPGQPTYDFTVAATNDAGDTATATVSVQESTVQPILNVETTYTLVKRQADGKIVAEGGLGSDYWYIVARKTVYEIIDGDPNNAFEVITTGADEFRVRVKNQNNIDWSVLSYTLTIRGKFRTDRMAAGTWRYLGTVDATVLTATGANTIPEYGFNKNFTILPTKVFVPAQFTGMDDGEKADLIDDKIDQLINLAAFTNDSDDDNYGYWILVR